MDWDISPMVGSGAGDRHFDGGFQQADAERARKQSVGPRTGKEWAHQQCRGVPKPLSGRRAYRHQAVRRDRLRPSVSGSGLMATDPAISRESRCVMIPAMTAEAKAAEPMMFSSTMSICASMTPEAERMLHRQESVLGRWATSADGTFGGEGWQGETSADSTEIPQPRLPPAEVLHWSKRLGKSGRLIRPAEISRLRLEKRRDTASAVPLRLPAEGVSALGSGIECPASRSP